MQIFGYSLELSPILCFLRDLGIGFGPGSTLITIEPIVKLIYPQPPHKRNGTGTSDCLEMKRHEICTEVCVHVPGVRVQIMPPPGWLSQYAPYLPMECLPGTCDIRCAEDRGYGPPETLAIS